MFLKSNKPSVSQNLINVLKNQQKPSNSTANPHKFFYNKTLQMFPKSNDLMNKQGWQIFYYLEENHTIPQTFILFRARRYKFTKCFFRVIKSKFIRNCKILTKNFVFLKTKGSTFSAKAKLT